MKLLSIDVGINNLSYVIMSINSEDNFTIQTWQNLDINRNFEDLHYVSSKYMHLSKPELIECCSINEIELDEKETSKVIKEKIKSLLKLKNIKKTNQIDYKKNLMPARGDVVLQARSGPWRRAAYDARQVAVNVEGSFRDEIEGM